ncbi:hypothetical protein V5799_026019, partial [Amblyomma americanum]
MVPKARKSLERRSSSVPGRRAGPGAIRKAFLRSSKEPTNVSLLRFEGSKPGILPVTFPAFPLLPPPPPPVPSAGTAFLGMWCKGRGQFVLPRSLNLM